MHICVNLLASPLTELGIILQALGSLMIGFPIWRGRKARGPFATEEAGFLGVQGRWQKCVFWGFLIYMASYLFLFGDVIGKTTG